MSFSQNRFVMLLKQTVQCLTLPDHPTARKFIQVRHLENVYLKCFVVFLFKKKLGFFFCTSIWYAPIS